MAVDTRPYKSKEQDGNGNEIIIRDQQLVEQSSQTTMASTEYFEIVDVDGRMAKIPKDNMIGVVREALGSLLNGLADQTTVAKFLTLNGNTLGASAAATAASVLGGFGSTIAITANTDLDSLSVGNYVSASSGISATLTHCPVQTAFTLKVEYGTDSYSCVQRLVATPDGACYQRMRYANGQYWSVWSRVDNFGCNTAADLASLLGGQLPIQLGNKTADEIILMVSQMTVGVPRLAYNTAQLDGHGSTIGNTLFLCNRGVWLDVISPNAFTINAQVSGGVVTTKNYVSIQTS